MTEIIIIGYPRSGNTWLSRLLGDALNCPVTGIGTAKPLAEEGLDRDSPHIVRQLHLKPTSIYGTDRPLDAWSSQAVDCAWWYGIENHNEEKQHPIIINRDPRDVSVSVAHYWQRETLTEAIDAMLFGAHPLLQIGPWHKFTESWLNLDFYIPFVKYEQLNVDTIGTLSYLLLWLKLESINPVAEVVRRQSFRARRTQLQLDGDNHPYGREIQVRNLRKGIVGDWKRCYTYKHGHKVAPYWNQLLLSLGYETSEDWYTKLPR